MPRAPTVRRSDLDRVLAALRAAGQDVARVEIRPGGEVVIVPTARPQVGAEQTALTPTPTAALPADLDGWRARKQQRGGRAAQGT